MQALSQTRHLFGYPNLMPALFLTHSKRQQLTERRELITSCAHSYSDLDS